MSNADLDRPEFQNDTEARNWLESQLWPDGPVCPHCGSFGQGVKKLDGNKKTHRPGLHQCNACREQFTVTVGTVMERSKIPLHIWLKATYLLCASKKGMSTNQLHRMLGVSLKSTWFLMHRIREAMRETHTSPMGGSNPVQADETFVGKRTMRNREWVTRGYQVKEPVLTLVGDGKARSFHVKEVNSATLKPILQEQIAKSASLFTDEATYYQWVKSEFAGHETITHSIKEYVRGDVTVNACENYFSIFKRGLNGVYRHVSPKHLKRYACEFDARYNSRSMSDLERTEKVAKGAAGKRLTYHCSRSKQSGNAGTVPPAHL